jgi:hypothetical protein
MSKSKYVLVNDHQARWVAERSDLLAELERAGWERDGNIWTEPESPDPNECDGVSPYTELCGAVADCSDDVTDEEREDMPQFSFRPDLGHDKWTMTSTL